ncbi:hypothetical protein RhiirA5_464529 [Rhizophagus irregularis]|uniref:Uncharacterized protein n=2 Tax=Rhizophagus irregularis TaxID=588596 RepID=A0A2N0NVA6_9GLOM|nr:hypothetical protein RhiirA5_464529 [Rhizophagus irregularis]
MDNMDIKISGDTSFLGIDETGIYIQTDRDTSFLYFKNKDLVKDFINKFNIAYDPPFRELLANRLFEDELGNVNSKIHKELQMSDNLTLALDRWSSSNYRSIWNFTILTPNRKEYIFQFSDLFSDSHTGEYIAEKKMLSIELEYQNFQLLSVIMDLMFEKHVN